MTNGRDVNQQQIAGGIPAAGLLMTIQVAPQVIGMWVLATNLATVTLGCERVGVIRNTPTPVWRENACLVWPTRVVRNHRARPIVEAYRCGFHARRTKPAIVAAKQGQDADHPRQYRGHRCQNQECAHCSFHGVTSPAEVDRAHGLPKAARLRGSTLGQLRRIKWFSESRMPSPWIENRAHARNNFGLTLPVHHNLAK